MKKFLVSFLALLSLVSLAGCGNDQKKASDSSKTEQSSKQDEQIKMKSFAKTFGNQSVKKVQDKVGTAYSSKKIGDDMVYGWKVDNMMFYRVDSPDNTTTVYCLKDGDKAENYKNGWGVKCYEGRTILD